MAKLSKTKRKKLKEQERLVKAEVKAYATSLRVAEKMLDAIHKKLKRKMKPGGGRLKGNKGENDIAKMIVGAFACVGIKREDCYRTPSSGGHRYAKEEDPGDLVISKRLRRYFPFHVEAKWYEKIDLNPFWLSEKKWKKSWHPAQWLKQTVSAAPVKKQGLHPLLVMRANKKEELAAVPELMPIGARILPRHKFLYRGEVWYLVRFRSLLNVMVRHVNGKD